MITGMVRSGCWEQNTEQQYVFAVKDLQPSHECSEVNYRFSTNPLSTFVLPNVFSPYLQKKHTGIHHLLEESSVLHSAQEKTSELIMLHQHPTNEKHTVVWRRDDFIHLSEVGFHVIQQLVHEQARWPPGGRDCLLQQQSDGFQFTTRWQICCRSPTASEMHCSVNAGSTPYIILFVCLIKMQMKATKKLNCTAFFFFKTWHDSSVSLFSLKK